MTPPVTIDQQGAAIAAASSKYQVPIETLLGVYGLETTYGYGTGSGSTSSTGAVGPFQFEPGTAATYNYPLTNTPTAGQFAAQADAAAHYLSDLEKQFGSWNKAAAAYNAGPNNVTAGAGYASRISIAFANTPKDLVKAVLRAGVSLPTGTDVPPGTHGPGGIAGGIDTAVTSAGDSLMSVGTFLGKVWSGLTSPKTWLRIAMGAGALFLIVFALFELSGHRSQAITVTEKVVRNEA